MPLRNKYQNVFSKQRGFCLFFLPASIAAVSAASMAYRGLGVDSGEYGDWLSRFLNLKNIRTP